MIKKIIFVWAYIFVLTASSLIYGAIPASERAALAALYNNTNGDNWTTNSGWKEGTLESDGFGPVGSEGTWYGITVSEDHVTEIDLHNNNLAGELSADLGNLAWLEKLELKNNWQLNGSIPPELGNPGRLEWLDLQNNYQMTGGIPPELGNLSQLKHLNLWACLLDGPIPPELGNLSSLMYLNLSTNNFTGTIPPELGNLGNLQTLIISWNTGLSGSIPSELGNLSNLKTLTLYLSLTGSIPSELGNLSNLENLTLGGNLSGSIPPELGNLGNLQVLRLSSHSLSGSIPSELGNLGNLKVLYLDGNLLTGSIPAVLGNLSNLEDLNLAANQLTGGIPPELGNLAKLKNLFLQRNRLTGSIPGELGNLSSLEILVLGGNQLGGSIPSSFTNLTNLNDFDMMDYDNSIDWNSLYTDDDELKIFLAEKFGPWENSQTLAPGDVSAAALSTSAIEVSWTPINYVSETGGYMVYYSTSPGGPWTYAGMTSDKSADSYTVTGLSMGTTYYLVIKTRTDPHSQNPNTITSQYSEEVSATTSTVPEEQDQPPFGLMELPVEGETPLSGSIAVSGWALDDVEVIGVKIYNVVGNSQAYIGDAVFVEGARPDIEQAYPGYPNNRRAGWGYMLLTNFLLPGQGNGTYTLRAIAADYLGHEIVLGTKTIVCDNANAVKPFGAIDTPAQGGTASGTNYRNSGWVLTPMPNKIPEDGSTINVYVDGVFLGHPTYNIYREDIYTLFPGYANRDGAHAFFDFDTTAYANGVHTIYWTAADDAGNSEGIGSRYFTVQNSAGSRMQGASSHGAWSMEHGARSTEPVEIVKGYEKDGEARRIYPDDKGIIYVEMKALDHLKMRFAAPLGSVKWVGYQVVGNQARALPIGSTLDMEKGVFYWHPGPGFSREFRFVFIGKWPNGEVSLKNITVRVIPLNK